MTSLLLQDYPQISNTKVYLADANSTDGTPDLARAFARGMDMEVIPGGVPSVGRNAGARRAQTPYVLFLDADMELDDTTLIRRALELMKRRKLHCVTTNIACPAGAVWDRMLYAGNNLMQHLSRLSAPFSTGMFMLWERQCFEWLGGFHEQVLFAEDYLLSQKVARRRFGIVPGHISTTNRRFKKMGHLKLIRLFLRTAVSWNESYYLRDHGYWHSQA